MPPELGARSLNHWTTQKVPRCGLLTLSPKSHLKQTCIDAVCEFHSMGHSPGRYTISPLTCHSWIQMFSLSSSNSNISSLELVMGFKFSLPSFRMPVQWNTSLVY